MALERYSGVTPVVATTVTVYAAGTQVPVDLYEDLDGLVPLSNPFTSDILTGAYTFVAEAAAFDIVLGSPDVDPAVRIPLPPSVIFNGTSPARHAILVVDDPLDGAQVVLADTVY